MRKVFLSLILALFLAAATLSLIQVARGQSGDDMTVLSQEVQGENTREIRGPSQGQEAQETLIGFIDSPSPTCYQPDPSLDQCYLSWYYLSVNGTPNSMRAMTLTLNDTGPAAHIQAFFQNSMFIPYNMLGEGFKVACGPLGAGGKPGLGNAYGYTIRARDSAGLRSANYGMTYCPAFQP